MQGAEDKPENAVILGIESSCDETAAAVVRGGRDLLSNVVFSQIATHLAYGGVVPELASREHLRAIAPVVRGAVAQAQLAYADLDAIAVTQGPGLAGALLVGITFAKALALALAKPLIAVNHIEGHIHAVLMNAQVAYPALALVVSGGHTHLYRVERAARYRNIGRTLDDAAGEAFDKVAKLLGLPYPGGPVIDALAAHGDPQAVKFSAAHIKPKIYRAKATAEEAGARTDFSFSGIKTAVLRHVELNAMAASIQARREALAENPAANYADMRALCDQHTLDLIASFQHAVVEDLTGKTLRAAEAAEVFTLIVSGGVAANAELRLRFAQRAAQAGLAVHFPARGLSTDNAAMIASAAYPKWVRRQFAGEQLSADPNLALG